MTRLRASRALAISALLFLAGCQAETTELAILGDPGARGEWDDLIDTPDTAGIRFGVKILGPSPFERETKTPFAPASNTKLYTAGEALALLGPSYRFETEIRWRAADREPGVAHDLEIAGSGDPTWGAGAFGQTLESPAERVAELLAADGIREVRGLTVSSDDTRWERLRYPQGWRPEDRTACYAALAQAVNLKWNCASYVLRGPTRGEWVEPEVPVRVELQVRPGAKTSLEVLAIDSGEKVADRFLIRGTWASKQAPVTASLPIHHSAAWFRALLRRSLEHRGIRVAPSDGTSGRPRKLTLLSPPVSEILVPFMKDSVNFIGHALFKHMGSRFGDPNDEDLLAASQEVMREFVETLGDVTASRMGVRSVRGFFSDQVALWDGSGISHDNRVTVEAMMTLLQDLAARGEFPSLWRSLPIAGVDGTLAARMRGTAAEDVLRAKTGTLSGVYNLSGYVPRLRDGAPEGLVPFVVLTHAAPGSAKPARAAQDRVGARLAERVNAEGYPGILWPLEGLL